MLDEVLFMCSKRDIDMLINVRKYLIEISKNVYRDYNFFFQAENKEQRREIYNHDVKIDDSSESYPIVCKSCCEMIKKDLISLYGYDVDVISCDSDEFGHCDILIKGDKKYIINCLSDLELNQVGMRSHRFASYEYCKERYSELLNDENIGFLSVEEVKKIDESIGFFDGMYFDAVIDALAKEFKNFKFYLKSDEGLRDILLGSVSDEYVDNMNIIDMLKAKFKFLCNYFNGRENIIGHIELIRIYKMLMKRFFSKEELKFHSYTDIKTSPLKYTFTEAKKIEIFIDFLESNYNQPEEVFQIIVNGNKEEEESSHSNGGAIGGGIAGAVGFIIIIVIVGYCCSSSKSDSRNARITVVQYSE